ncbi:MAG: MAPEG family protein [Gammaproteobacteria bacterium]|nr:MAG: MAPEG family protein [Gammaproteobacteria bacterium]
MTAMSVPAVSAATAGAILLLQMILMINVGRHRTRTRTLLGDGTDPALQRSIRVHANLAENAALFLVGFALLELITGPSGLLIGLCTVFVLARIAHAVGLSRTDGPNPGRFLGALGTLVVGAITAGALLWYGGRVLLA